MADQKRAIKVVSGGQTGVDRAALDAAFDLGIARGGWCPRGKWAEDGTIPELYPLLETPSQETIQRTRWNVRDSDGTLVLFAFKVFGGTAETLEYAKELRKPVLALDLQVHPDHVQVAEWIMSSGIVTLNVAGPRESEAPGIYTMAKDFMERCLSEIHE